MEQRTKYSFDNDPILQSYNFVEYINCFHSIGLEYQSLFPVKIKTKPCIAIAKRKKEYIVPVVVPKEPQKKIVQEIAPIENKYEFVKDDRDEPDEPLIDDKDDRDDTDESIEESRDVEEINDLDDSDASDADVSEEEDEETMIVDEEDADLPNELFDNIVNSEEINDIFINQNITESLEESHSDQVDEARKPRSDHRKRVKNTKIKLRKVIELYYRSKGSLIESETETVPVTDTQQESSPNTKSAVKEPQQISKSEAKETTERKKSTKTNIKKIIKAEKIKQLVEKISTLDLKALCDLETLSAKDCLMKVIDEYATE